MRFMRPESTMFPNVSGVEFRWDLQIYNPHIHGKRVCLALVFWVLLGGVFVDTVRARHV